MEERRRARRLPPEQACAVRMADGTPSAVMPLRKEPPVTVPGRIGADAWSVPTGSALNGCHTCAGDYHPVTPCGSRCRSRYGCEAAAGLRACGKVRGSRSTRSGAAAAPGTRKRRRAHPVRKEPATRRPVRWPTRLPLRQASGGDRTGPDAGRLPPSLRVAPPGKACHTGAHGYQPATTCGRPVPEPVWRAHARAASVSAKHCSWQPLRLPRWGQENRRRACHIDTATSLRSEDGVRQAFRRDASAQRPPVTVPKSNNGDAWR